jgi:tetratricopeptide (TPR) repeat protein
VLRAEGGGRGRFGFHPVMLAFLRERTPEAVRADAARAHRTFYAALVEHAVGRLERERPAVVERLEADLTDVVAAAQSFLDAGEPARAISMLRVLIDDVDYFQARGAGGELIVLARSVALAAESIGDLDAAERLWTKVANAVRSLHGAPEEAARLYARALDLAERAGDVARQVMLHAILGAVLDERAPDAADRHMSTAQALAEASGDDLLTCEVLQRWGFVAARRKEWGRVRTLTERSVATAERLLATQSTPSPRVASLLFFSLHNLGAAVYEEGAMAASLPIRTRALEFARERSNDLWAAYALDELAGLLHDLGRTPEALEHAAQALHLYERLGAVDDQRVLADEVAAWTVAVAHAPEAGATKAVPTGGATLET